MKLEICVDSLQSALNAAEGGADRLELASALTLGGLTPTVGLLSLVKEMTSVPVFCLIRPRQGDFVSSPMEVMTMTRDIQRLKEAGADGFVIGALQPDGNVNRTVMTELIGACGSLPTTFHRAIDVCCDWKKGLDDIIQLGCHRVLTSGSCQTAFEGRFNIRKFIDHVCGQIVVMPGAGVNSDNISEILQVTGATECHASASVAVKSATESVRSGAVRMGPTDNCDNVRVTDAGKVAELKRIGNLC